MTTIEIRERINEIYDIVKRRGKISCTGTVTLSINGKWTASITTSAKYKGFVAALQDGTRSSYDATNLDIDETELLTIYNEVKAL